MVMESVRQAICDHSMLPSGERVLVAVSGGQDSIVLLDVLHRLSAELQFPLVVGHIDHGLREEASVQDAIFVQQVADAYNLESVKHRLTRLDLQQQRAHGREGAARIARLAKLEALAADAGASRIALGHTLDDHAETILYRLARGTGPTGMRGIAPVRLPFIRPLIHTLRADVHTYAIDRGLTWREDSTNTDLSYARNRIRHRIVPELRQLNPQVVEALARSAELLADLDEATSFLVGRALNQCQAKSGDSAFCLSRNGLAVLPSAVARLIIREAIRQERGDLDGIELAHIDAILRLADSQRAHGQLSLPRLHIRMQSDTLSLSPAPATSAQQWRIPVNLGITSLPGNDSTLELEIVLMADLDMESVRSDRWTEVADADRVTFPLHLRTRRHGDRFTPLGMEREIKLKDFLINEHASYFDRDEIPLLCDDRTILWVAGIRLSDTVKLSDRTQRMLLMRMKGVR